MPGNTIIFTHGDCDGICSGALALAANEKARVFFTNPVSIADDLKEADGADGIIVCDIAVDADSAMLLKKMIDMLSKKAYVVYIDHHPLPQGFGISRMIHDVNACASEITYAYFRQSLDADMSRVAIYGAIGDYRDDTPLISMLAKTWDRRSLYYEAGTLSQGLEIGRRDYDYKRDLVEALSKNVLPSEIEMLAKNAVLASRQEEGLRVWVRGNVVRMDHISYVIDPDGFISRAAVYARIYGGTCVGVAAEHLKSKDSYDVSVRAKGSYDLNVLVGRAARRYGGTGGGHPEAAGGRIPAVSLMGFLRDLDEALGVLHVLS